MPARKNPILLRRGPLSGSVNALTNYRFLNGGKTLKVVGDGKQDVSHDFDALALEELIDNGAENIVAILDGVADGDPITDDQRAEVRVLRERLKTMIERHNERLS